MGTSITSTGVTFPDATTQTTAATTAFGAGTVMLFAQTAAPTGWTKDTTNYNNSAIRIVTGTVSTGGSVDFTTAFASQTPAGTVSVSVSAGTLAASNGTLAVGVGTLAVGSGTLAVGIGTLTAAATTLSTAQLASHGHPFAFRSNYYCVGSAYLTAGGVCGVQLRTDSGASTTASSSVQSSGSGTSHSHSMSGSPSLSGSPALSGAPALSGSVSLSGAPSVTSSTFTGTAINLAVKYVDVIRATKN